MIGWLKRLVAGAELAELDELRERVVIYEELISEGRPAPKSWADIAAECGALNAEMISAMMFWGKK